MEPQTLLYSATILFTVLFIKDVVRAIKLYKTRYTSYKTMQTVASIRFMKYCVVKLIKRINGETFYLSSYIVILLDVLARELGVISKI